MGSRGAELTVRHSANRSMKGVHSVLCLLLGLGSPVAHALQVPAKGAPERVAELARAETKWQTSRIDAYEFRIRHACNGLIPVPPPGVPPGPLFRIEGGETRFLRADVDAEPVAPDLVQYSTVERLFASVRAALARPVRKMEVQYDQAHGYPTRLCVDPSVVADDEFGFVVTDFKVLSERL